MTTYPQPKPAQGKKPTIIMSIEPSDTDAAMNGLHANLSWLLELSNSDPASFSGQEGHLYSALNILQLITSRFSDRVAPLKRPDRQLDATLERVSEAMAVLPEGAA